MGSTITVYLEPEKVTSFNWEGPDVFRFENRMASHITSGFEPIGAILQEGLTSEERELLNPKGHINEDSISPINPKVLKDVIFKIYERAAQIMLVESKDYEEAMPEGWNRVTLFNKLQRDIAGAVLICDRAIERGCQVYLALW